MSAELKNERGSIIIPNQVIAKIAGDAATKCYGVVGMAGGIGKDGIASLLKREVMDRGIKIRITENAVMIEVNVIVEYGINIRSVAEILKDRVKYQVEQETGLEVLSVSVNVAGIRFESAK